MGRGRGQLAKPGCRELTGEPGPNSRGEKEDGTAAATPTATATSWLAGGVFLIRAPPLTWCNGLRGSPSGRCRLEEPYRSFHGRGRGRGRGSADFCRPRHAGAGFGRRAAAVALALVLALVLALALILHSCSQPMAVGRDRGSDSSDWHAICFLGPDRLVLQGRGRVRQGA